LKNAGIKPEKQVALAKTQSWERFLTATDAAESRG
jgi:hypothetical protein